MARTPLFPRGGDFSAWALNITQRIERDYAELKAENDSLSAAFQTDLHSVSAVIKTDINSVSAAIKTDIGSVSAAIKADISSVSAVLESRIDTKVKGAAIQFNLSITTGQLVTISFTTAFSNTIKSVVASPMNDGAVGADDWIAINSYSLGGFIARYNSITLTGTRSLLYIAFGA